MQRCPGQVSEQMTNEGHYLLQPRSPCGLSLCNCYQCNTFLYSEKFFHETTTHYFSKYQYTLHKVANQGKLQYSSLCKVEQQALCHRTSINHLSSLRCCTLSLNTFFAWHETLYTVCIIFGIRTGITDMQNFDYESWIIASIA